MSADLLPEMALIPAGEFLMGSDDAEEDERPVHHVELEAYSIGVQPVTNGEYARFVRDTGHRPPAIYELPLVVTAGGRERENAFRAVGQSYIWAESEPTVDRHEHPVTLVRWEDATAYCSWLAAETGRAVRLPTEAEWEKAARGGLPGKRYPWGDRLDRNLANFLTDPTLKLVHGTTRCRSYPPNAYGPFDMTGNVWEWVQDCMTLVLFGLSCSIHRVRAPDRCASCAAAAGSWRTCACCRAAIDTRSRRIRIRTVSASGLLPQG
jgi:formylglycine-generating enzyme required for sulfatase activity